MAHSKSLFSGSLAVVASLSSLLLPLPVAAQDSIKTQEGTHAVPSAVSAPPTEQHADQQGETVAPVEYVYVALNTTLGTITLALDKTHAPITVANFLKYVDGKRFDGMSFYRAMHLDGWSEPAGLLQGGLQGATGKVLPPIAHEPTNVTGLSHTAGTISMARFAPGSATADFTIMINDLKSLDADPQSDNPDSRAGFAAFGHVVAGMDVVKAIWNEPLSATKGEGVMRGQILEKPVVIQTVRRTQKPAP